MRSLYIFYPAGNETLAPDVAEVLRFMHCPYEKNWGLYNPVAFLTWDEKEYEQQLRGSATWREQLTVLRHIQFGWWFLFHFEDTWLSPFAVGGARDKWVEQWYGGETKFFLRDAFVGATECDVIVTEFMNSARPAPGIHWEPLDDIHSSYCDELDDFGGECIAYAPD